MGIEIERKFLVSKTLYRPQKRGCEIRQIYLYGDANRSIRIRIIDNKSYITIKSSTETAIKRNEFEYKIPLSDAMEMFKIFTKAPSISKIRYTEYIDGKEWVVDEFLGKNMGLLIAEIELTNEAEKFKKPLWVLDEVTEDVRYLNFNLARHPISV